MLLALTLALFPDQNFYGADLGYHLSIGRYL